MSDGIVKNDITTSLDRLDKLLTKDIKNLYQRAIIKFQQRIGKTLKDIGLKSPQDVADRYHGNQSKDLQTLTGNLYRSFHPMDKHSLSKVEVSANEVTAYIGSDLPYSMIQEEGGNIPVTLKSKKYFWYMYYLSKGKNPYWKYLALKKLGTMKIKARHYFTKALGKFKDEDWKEIEKGIGRAHV